MMSTDPINSAIKKPKKIKVATLFSSISENAGNWMYWGGQLLLVIAAIAGAVGAFAMIVGDRVRDRFGDQRMSENELKTANANQRAAEAEQRAAEATQRAAEANQKAESERLERLKLEKKLAPRVISPDEQQSIGDRIRPFAPRVIDIFSFHPASVEIARFHNELVKAIANGGWTGRVFGVIKPGLAFRGIVITTKAPADPNADKAADALASALSEIGITSTRRESFIGAPWEVVDGKIGATVANPWNPANIAQIVIMIGEKR